MTILDARPALDLDLGQWVPYDPTARQWAAHLLYPVFEVLYGGAAGGAKSWWLLGEALRDVDTPGYSAILFRNTLNDLRQQPDGLIPTLARWLDGSGATWLAQDRTWVFPSGATISFGYLQDHKGDRHLKYAGPSWQMIGIDQAEQFRPEHYRFLFSRLRKPKGRDVALRFRATANPGGSAHNFLVERFRLLSSDLDPWNEDSRAYMPSRLEDNPHMDPSYERSLAQLDEIDYRRLRLGDWTAAARGAMFNVSMLLGALAAPPHAQRVRAWDLAATEAVPGTDPDYTVGALVARSGEEEWIEDIARDRRSPDGVDRMMMACAARDGTQVPIVVEMESKSAGRREIAHIRRALPGYRVIGVPPRGTKMQRAGMLARWVNQGKVSLIGGPWVPALVDELRIFGISEKEHDDQVDAIALAHNWLDLHNTAWVPQARRNDPRRLGGPIAPHELDTGQPDNFSNRT